MDTVRPMLHSRSIFNLYWVVTTIVVVVDLLMVLVLVQQFVTVAKLLFRWHTKNLELPDRWVIIHLGQGRVHGHDHCHIACLLLK